MSRGHGDEMLAPSRVQVALCLMLAGLAGGHRSLPPGVTCGNQFSTSAAALEVPNPAISWASYRMLTCDAPVFWLKAEDVALGQSLSFTVTVPVIERFADVRVSVLVIGPGLPNLSSAERARVPADVLADIRDGEGAALFASPEDQSNCAHLRSAEMASASDVADGRCHFHEPYGDTHSWVLLDETLIAADGGSFRFAVFSADGTPAKLSFACCDWPEDFTTAYAMPDAECPFCGTMANFSSYSSHFYEAKDMAEYGGFPAAGSCGAIGDSFGGPSATQCPPAQVAEDWEQQPQSCILGCTGEECHSHNIFGDCTYPVQWVTPRPHINDYNVTSLAIFRGSALYFTSAGDTWPHNLVQMASASKLEQCDFSESTQILSVGEVLSGTAVTFDQAGIFHYSCQMTGHCGLGQKLTVEVKDSTDGMRCHDQAFADAEVLCQAGEITAHVLGSSEYGARTDECSEFCTSVAGLAWITGGAQGTCSDAGFSVTVSEQSVQPAGSPAAVSVVVKSQPDPDILCQEGEIIAHVLGNAEYGAEADQCSEFCTSAQGLAWITGGIDGACSVAGYSVTVSEQGVQPTGSPAVVDVVVKAVRSACHCHSYEEIACTEAGDSLYDEHIAEIQTYCQGVAAGSEDACPYKCSQPFEVLHLHYLECSLRPEHHLYAQIAATRKCHVAAAAPSADACGQQLQVVASRARLARAAGAAPLLALAVAGRLAAERR